MKKFALIVAGGSGTRMEQKVPKQFIEINGLPLLMHTINCFTEYDSDIVIIVVLPDNEIRSWKNLCEKHSFKTKHQLTAGGKTRFFSVKNGLEQIQQNGVVFIHDGVRPLVSGKTIDACYNMALEKGNALPVVPVTESVRKVENNINQAVDRSKLYLVQTPQTFRIELIKEAYKQPFSQQFTDDASVLENIGTKINLVEGNRENIKITYPEDLLIAGVFLKNKTL